MPNAGGKSAHRYETTHDAVTALSRAAVRLAKTPKDAEARVEYERTAAGVGHYMQTGASEAEYKSRLHHFQWHRLALRRALEEPEMQSTDARYVGYLCALRRIAKELNVTWPPYGQDEVVHTAVPPEALVPLPSPVSRSPRRRR